MEIESFNLFYMVQLALLFVLFVTGAWKKSIATSFLVIALAILEYDTNGCVPITVDPYSYLKENSKYSIITIITILLVIRTILHKETDKLIRGKR